MQSSVWCWPRSRLRRSHHTRAPSASHMCNWLGALRNWRLLASRLAARWAAVVCHGAAHQESACSEPGWRAMQTRCNAVVRCSRFESVYFLTCACPSALSRACCQFATPCSAYVRYADAVSDSGADDAFEWYLVGMPPSNVWRPQIEPLLGENTISRYAKKDIQHGLCHAHNPSCRPRASCTMRKGPGYRECERIVSKGMGKGSQASMVQQQYTRIANAMLPDSRGNACKTICKLPSEMLTAESGTWDVSHLRLHSSHCHTLAVR
jgi:hypothetical protein